MYKHNRIGPWQKFCMANRKIINREEYGAPVKTDMVEEGEYLNDIQPWISSSNLGSSKEAFESFTAVNDGLLLSNQERVAYAMAIEPMKKDVSMMLEFVGSISTTHISRVVPFIGVARFNPTAGWSANNRVSKWIELPSVKSGHTTHVKEQILIHDINASNIIDKPIILGFVLTGDGQNQDEGNIDCTMSARYCKSLIETDDYTR